MNEITMHGDFLVFGFIVDIFVPLHFFAAHTPCALSAPLRCFTSDAVRLPRSLVVLSQ